MFGERSSDGAELPCDVGGGQDRRTKVADCLREWHSDSLGGHSPPGLQLRNCVSFEVIPRDSAVSIECKGIDARPEPCQCRSRRSSRPGSRFRLWASARQAGCPTIPALTDRSPVTRSVHDEARPFVTEAEIDAAASRGAAIAAAKVHDTVKHIVRDGDLRWIDGTIPRDAVSLAQTPQGFRRDVVAAWLPVMTSPIDVTDEASLAERLGHRVQVRWRCLVPRRDRRRARHRGAR